MKVILQQDDKKLGKRGDVIEVADGYARNFLLPKNLAVAASQGNLNQARQRQSAENFQAKLREDQARVLASQMNKITLDLTVKAGEQGKLFGSITAKDIADALLQKTGLEIDRRKIELKDPIKAVGDYKVLVRLYPEISAELALQVREG